MVLSSSRRSPSYNLPPTNFSRLLINLLFLSCRSIAWIIALALSLSTFLQTVYGKYSIQIRFRISLRAHRTSLSVPSLNLWSSSIRINLFFLSLFWYMKPLRLEYAVYVDFHFRSDLYASGLVRLSFFQ
ncbi:hypothetical protein Tco_1083166 [Tanacetum coccineum]|uniref:Uncharacterized protein n=1 Tax=Tanacetum coccineum TaxID=301880 RepID=A0ABQ5I2F8_9ASTR